MTEQPDAMDAERTAQRLRVQRVAAQAHGVGGGGITRDDYGDSIARAIRDVMVELVYAGIHLARRNHRSGMKRLSQAEIKLATLRVRLANDHGMRKR